MVLQRLRNAEAVFFAGGDQNNYVTQWENSPISAIIQTLSTQIPIGGTSAGCAILGQFIFTAAHDTIESPDALANPYDPRVTLGAPFATLAPPFLGGVITDPHFVTRDRMGRLVTFMARLVADGWADSSYVTGIGIDEQTALLIDPFAGHTQVVTNPGINGTAYIVNARQLPTPAPEVCKPNTPLTYQELSAMRLDSGKLCLCWAVGLFAGD